MSDLPSADLPSILGADERIAVAARTPDLPTLPLRPPSAEAHDMPRDYRACPTLSIERTASAPAEI
ncbi:MAG: hypothetical protein WAM50_14485 [Pseudolabrys sp.]